MLDKDIILLKGIGEKTANYFYEQNIHNCLDLLYRIPVDYRIYDEIDPNSILINQNVYISGLVTSNVLLRKFHNSVDSLIFSINCNGLIIKVLVFGQAFLRFKIRKGMKIFLYGNYHYETKEIIAKEIHFNEQTKKIEAIYNVPNVPNKKISNLIECLFRSNEIALNDEIPSYLLIKYRLLEINDYYRKAHFPTNSNDIKQITRRRKYEKYLNLCLSYETIRYYYDTTYKNPKIFDYNRIKTLIDSLPYELSNDQENVINTLLNEAKSPNIMNRLVQGDVGSGKSIVALLIAYANVLADYQVAIMVPTEILAFQHYQYFSNILKKYDINIALYTSNLKQSEKNDILQRLIHKRIDIIIGTNALTYDQVKFNKLGLVIIDEQHRFGVNDREKLVSKSDKADALYLTATPIPRTLGITRFLDLDLSSIKTKPIGKKDPITKVASFSEINNVFNNIRKELEKGFQVFVVVPLKEKNDSDLMDLNEAVNLFNENIPEFKTITLHGSMEESLKDKNMLIFKNHQADILIATTVIEVGIDIKNATSIIIFNANRYGLSQLHQLRGRVGRNSEECYCYLISDDIDNKRLKIMENCFDCFKLSEEDLLLRGPGDFLGDKQSGFLINEALNDLNIYNCAKADAKELYLKYINKEDNYEIINKIVKNKKTKIN